MQYILEIRDLVLPVHLGCEAEEREVPQEVAFSVAVRMPGRPQACVTDDLNDSICYAEISEVILKQVVGREFKLIEYLAQEVFQAIKAMRTSDFLMRLEIHKLHPPVANLRGGSFFSIGEF